MLLDIHDCDVEYQPTDSIRSFKDITNSGSDSTLKAIVSEHMRKKKVKKAKNSLG